MKAVLVSCSLDYGVPKWAPPPRHPPHMNITLWLWSPQVRFPFLVRLSVYFSPVHSDDPNVQFNFLELVGDIIHNRNHTREEIEKSNILVWHPLSGN